MKQIVIGVVSILVVIVIFIGVLGWLRVPICKGKLLGFFRPYVQFFCPPKDLYERLLNEQIDITAANKEQIFKFKVEYIGSYWVRFILDDLSEELQGKEYDLKLNIRLDFYENGILLVSKKTNDYYDKSWGLGRGKGEICCDFKSPEEIPIDTEITCKVIILATDEYLAGHCNRVRLNIHKLSEE